MPSSAVQVFSDPDDYAASIRGTRSKITVTARGRFSAKRTRIDLHRLWMQRFCENLPRILHFSFAPDRAGVIFRTQPGPDLFWGGAEMPPSNLLRHSRKETFQRSSGSAGFAAMTLPIEEMVLVGAAVGRCDLTSPRDTLVVIPRASAMAKLKRLHAAAGRLAEDTPEIIAHLEAARGLEQALIQALVDCLAGGEVRADRSAQRRHSLIMRRFHRVVEENLDHALYISELYAALGVSERTLQICCREQLGMSAKRYLTLRRMHLARRALRDSAPGTTTVTEIATRYGFWQFGRFAGEYKSLFGETPSATRRSPREQRRDFCGK